MSERDSHENEQEYACPVCRFVALGQDEREDHADNHPGVKPEALMPV